MLLVLNKSATHDYTLQEQYTAGLVLSGAEVKSLRLKHASLKGSHVKIIGQEAFLLNAQINPYSFAVQTDYDPKQSRKLLLKKKEILKLQEASDRKNTAIIPVKIELLRNRIKLVVAIAKGKKEFEKRAVLKSRTQKRELERQLKERVRIR